MRCAWSLSILFAAAACSIGAGFDCDVGFDNWERGWTPEKKRWCCENGGRGCHHFDCNDGLENWQAEWSPDKKVACCSETGHGCEGSSGPIDISAPGHFDCNAILKDGEEGFSPEQKEWCCATQHVACGQWDCNFAAPHTWPNEKQEYCCSHSGQGCAPAPGPMAPPGQWEPPGQSAPPGQPAPEVPSTTFDCDIGYDRWEAGWSANKIKWCCDTHNVACEPWDCAEGGQGAWPQAKRDYCCKTQSLACPADYVSKLKVGLPSQWFAPSSRSVPGPLRAVSIAAGALAFASLLAVRLRPTPRHYVPNEDPSIALVDVAAERLAGGCPEDGVLCE